MKYIILVPDGLADRPLKELGGKTPMEAARTPNMDYMARTDFLPLCRPSLMECPQVQISVIWRYLAITRMIIFQEGFSGSSQFRIILKEDEVVFRCNLVTVKDDKMVDYSAGHISTDEAKNLIEHFGRVIDWPDVRFYVGKSYRHLMVMKTINVPAMFAINTVPPHDIMDRNSNHIYRQAA